MTLKCKSCGHKGKPILKLGGLICSECRIILKTPDTKEWQAAFRKGQKRDSKT